MNSEIKFDHFKNLEELKQNVENWLATDEMYWERWFGLRDIKTLLDIITNLEKKIEYNDLVLKALHRYFTEHECYETHKFLRQLESCTENDMVWLKRMAGDNNE